MTGLRLTLPHHSVFSRDVGLGVDGLRSAASWDALRIADAGGSFGFGSSRSEWEQRAIASADLRARAAAIMMMMRDWGATKVVSVGVGTGSLEYVIKRLVPNVHLRCGDFAPETLALLKERFVECDWIGYANLADGSFFEAADEVVLLHRVDTELSDAEWAFLFSLLSHRGCRYVIFVPSGLLTPVAFAREIWMGIKALTTGKVLRRAGFLRTPSRMRQLFEGGYEATSFAADGGLPIWALELRSITEPA